MTQLQDDWTEARIEALIRDKVPESPILDYKASAALSGLGGSHGRELSKDVAALANAAGGVLIYGIAADPQNKTLPSRIDEGVLESELPFERLEQTIYANIRPRLQGMRVTAVPLTDKPGRVIYVITVSQGDTAHQAADMRYHVRRGLTTEAMLDHEIRDVMNRRKYPVLEPEFSYMTLNADGARHRYQLSIKIENVGSVLARAIKLEFLFPRVLVRQDDSYSHLLARGVATLDLHGRIHDCLSLQIRETEAMIFPGDTWNVLEAPGARWLLTYSVDHDSFARFTPDDEIVPWKLFADDMQPRTGAATYREIQNF
jgi:hypothetical protein